MTERFSCSSFHFFLETQNTLLLPFVLQTEHRKGERREAHPMWETMYEEFWDKLEHFCAKLCRDESRAEDLTQEVFLRALQNRELIDGFNVRQCKAWLFATARNLYCDQIRRRAKEEELLASLLPDGEEAMDETASAAMDEVDLGNLLDLLSPGDRVLFTLRYEEGYNASELSKIFHLPPGTVRTRLMKARTLLKHELLEE